MQVRSIMGSNTLRLGSNDQYLQMGRVGRFGDIYTHARAKRWIREMGSCFSTNESNNNSKTSATTSNKHHHMHKATTKPLSSTKITLLVSIKQKVVGFFVKSKENSKNQLKKSVQANKKPSSTNHGDGGVIPCGKITDFGYDKDFDKRYTIGKLLGHGSFGCTFIATDNSNKDHVAVKRLEKNKMVRPIDVKDVKKEVKILKALAGYENVVQFYNTFEDDSYVYIVMELCEGGNLADRILAKKGCRYNEKDAVMLVRQMLKVVAECHLHGLVHRDIKPENFVFKLPKDDSPLKATDFGLSEFIKQGKKFRALVGSARYVAPEVVKRSSGPKSDVWSIGIITYILLSGQWPFWDETEDGLFQEVLKKTPDFECEPWPSISNGAKDFVKKLLVKDPRGRLAAAQALSHPWVREGGDASYIPLDISVLSNMRRFAKYNRLKRFGLRALATTLDEEELVDLRDQFDAIDVDKNGSISLVEMRLALSKDLLWKLTDSRVLEILQAMDSNNDGLVDFMEFVAATLHVHQMEEHDSEKWQQRTEAAFEKIDVDKDGYITLEELQMHTGLRGSIDLLLEEEVDIDKDGNISLSEFQRLLKNKGTGSRVVVISPDEDQDQDQDRVDVITKVNEEPVSDKVNE